MALQTCRSNAVCASDVQGPPDHRRFLLETAARKADAEAVLSSLLAAKLESDRATSRLKRPDPMRAVTGNSAIDRAIVTTRNLIGTLDRALADIRRELAAEDMNAAGLDEDRCSGESRRDEVFAAAGTRR